MRPFSAAAVALGLIAALSACARPGNTPAGTPTARTEVTVWASAQMMAEPAIPPGLIAAAPGTPGVPCDSSRAAVPKPATAVRPNLSTSVQPKPLPRATTGASSDAAADARERARRVLEAANPPVPRRGPLPPEAAARAEACVRALHPELTLLAHSPGWPDDQQLRTVLGKTGLTGIVVGPGSAFAAAAGRACVYGTFSTDGPDLSIGPQEGNGACRL